MKKRSVRSHRNVTTRPFPRVARLNALVHEVVAEEIGRAADGDERLALITPTHFACEPDPPRAVVYLASLPPDVAEALEEHRRNFQAALGKQSRLKRTPLLSFVIDPAIVE